MSDTNEKDDMSLEERVDWLRDRGVQIETPEERKRVQVAKVIRNVEGMVEDEISYVFVPADRSNPLQEFKFQLSDYVHTTNNSDTEVKQQIQRGGDLLLQHLRPAFTSNGEGKGVDVELLKKHGSGTTLASSIGLPTSSISDETLRQVAAEANIEVFALVKPLPGNNFTGVNIYLDEVGMLKRLPLNQRASEYASHCGFNPPPQFYGDVFIGRIKQRPTLHNVSFVLGADTAMDAPWLIGAMNDNLTYQMEMNEITGQKDVRQPSIAGQDGTAKVEDGYSWTQTESELEMYVLAPSDTTTKDIQIKFHPQSIQILYKKDIKVNVRLFERVDIDSCTWTLEKSNGNTDDEVGTKRLQISMEKLESAFWPRIED